jgi:glycosyltransferase involved in cell wall biosynthesis
MNVVMIVQNRLSLTRQSIESLIRNTIRPFTLTIVDDCSQPETANWLQGLQHYYLQNELHLQKLIVTRNSECKGVGGSKNAAVEITRGLCGKKDLLYISDNDVYFTPAWDVVAAQMQMCYGDKVKVIGAYNHPYHQPTWTASFRVAGFNGDYTMTGRESVSGVSWLLTWDTWEEFGPLDDKARGVRMSEDHEFCQKAKKAGYEVGAIEPWVVHHCGLIDSFGQRPPGWEIMGPTPEQIQRYGLVVE